MEKQRWVTSGSNSLAVRYLDFQQFLVFVREVKPTFSVSNYTGCLEFVVCVVWRWWYWQPFSARVAGPGVMPGQGSCRGQGSCQGQAAAGLRDLTLTSAGWNQTNFKSLWCQASIIKQNLGYSHVHWWYYTSNTILLIFYTLFLSIYHKFKSSSSFRIMRYKKCKFNFLKNICSCELFL